MSELWHKNTSALAEAAVWEVDSTIATERNGLRSQLSNNYGAIQCSILVKKKT